MAIEDVLDASAIIVLDASAIMVEDDSIIMVEEESIIIVDLSIIIVDDSIIIVDEESIIMVALSIIMVLDDESIIMALDDESIIMVVSAIMAAADVVAIPELQDQKSTDVLGSKSGVLTQPLACQAGARRTRRWSRARRRRGGR